MSKKKFREKQKARKAAKEGVPALFTQATAEQNQKRGSRLVRKGRRLAMKFRFSLSPYKHLYCKHCYARLVPGRNARVRIHGSKVITHCAECKKYRRVPLKGAKRE